MKNHILNISAAVAFAMTLQGCNSLMNVGESDFTCPGTKPNEAFRCMGVRALYKETDGPLNQLDKTKAGKSADKTNSSVIENSSVELINNSGDRFEPTPNMDKPMPLRSQARVMRIWISPYEDDDGDLNAAGLVYTEIESRRWNMGERLVRKPTQVASLQSTTKQTGVGMPVNAGMKVVPQPPSTKASQPTAVKRPQTVEPAREKEK